MIEVAHLTRKYGDLTAIQDLTFQIAAGEVVAFLGANGAGKTTTLRILSGYLAPTSGHARIAGFDIGTHSLEARRRIGYLPEAVPLYGELRVDEYLHFRAELKGVARARRAAEVERVSKRCGLDGWRTKTIATLSRGFRQRVGLADALLGQPPLLILDEPTSGLDPLQRLEVRRLLSELREEHTVLLSTHILPEAEATCRRVLILRQGRLVPETDLLKIRNAARYRVACLGPAAEIQAGLQTLPTVERLALLPAAAAGEREAAAPGALQLELLPREGQDPREELLALFSQRRAAGWRLLELERRTPSLEELFAQASG